MATILSNRFSIKEIGGSILQCIFGLFSERGKEYTTQESMSFFLSLKIPQDIFMKLNQIQEAHNIKADSWQGRMMFLVPLLSGKVIEIHQSKEAHKH